MLASDLTVGLVSFPGDLFPSMPIEEANPAKKANFMIDNACPMGENF